MASSLTPAQIESADPDAWTGKPTAIVYETTAEAAAFLAFRGLTVFGDSTDQEQDTALLLATEQAEDYIRGKIRGVQVQEGQRLYLPAAGAYDRPGGVMRASGDLLLERSVVSFLEGIRLIAEHLRIGDWRSLTGTGISSKKREETRVYQVERFEGGDPEGLAEQHRDVYGKLSAILPRFT